MMKKPRIAITMGDPAGIGPEILVKALANPKTMQKCIPVVFGSTLPLEDALAMTGLPLRLRLIASPEQALGEPGFIDYLDIAPLARADWQYGATSAKAGDASFKYIVRAIDMAMANRVDAVTTGPITKEALHMAGHHFSGHTEIFAQFTGASQYAMLLQNGNLRVIHVTTHVSMRKACDLIQKDRVLQTIRLASKALSEMGLAGGLIGVAGLNAHASENGLFGSEEQEQIIPAIKEAQAQGIPVEGPVPPDTVFVKAMAGKYDMVVAMYHDQGHIPLKLSGFRMDPGTGLFSSVSGINTTVGLPIIRTSVDHGTAYDRAGKNMANEESLLDAMDLAVQMALARKE